jgi:hypothetical protein
LITTTGDNMTQYTDRVKQQEQKLTEEESNKKVISYEYQRGAELHFRKIKYANGKEVTTDLSNKS